MRDGDDTEEGEPTLSAGGNDGAAGTLPPDIADAAEDQAALFTLDDKLVRESGWAGSYYCAHLYFVLQQLARTPHLGVPQTALGEPLVGFLHVPADDQAVGLGARMPRSERHKTTRAVVAAALRGLLDDVTTLPAVRVLITGFREFPGIVDNPTGDFVGDGDSVLQALATGQAPARVAVKSRDEAVMGAAGVRRDIVRSQGRDLVITRALLDVDDSVLDPTSETSAQALFMAVRPHIVLSLGVHRGRDYRVEVNADTAGLAIVDGIPRHEDGRQARSRLPANHALARALVRGRRALEERRLRHET